MRYPRDHDRQIKTEDLVLIHNENLPRRNWRLGEVTDLIESRDGRKRGAALRVVSKKGTHLKLRRPIQKLVSLEVGTGKSAQESHPRTEMSERFNNLNHGPKL